MRQNKCHLLAILALMPTIAFSALNVDPNNTSVTPGVWCGNFPAAKAYAEQNAMPLVLFWGNEGCTHCAALNSALSTSDALSWAAKQRAVFCFVEGKSHNDVSPNYGAKEFAQKAGGMSPATPTAYPYVCYYMVNDKAMTYGGIEQFNVFKNNYEQFLSTLKKTGAYFPFGDTVNDRLEAILGETAWVDIPVMRSGDLSAATTRLEIKSGAASWEANLSWAAEEAEKIVRYTLPAAFQTARSATVTLKAPDSTVLDERTITGVVEVENSTKNPKWIGEEIDYGEWTMDLDAVTNLVKKSGGHALVLFAGGCWCPDCAMTDARLFDREEFKQWAKSNRVALGLIDIPNNPSSTANYPSLLTYTSYRTSDSYVTLRSKTAPADETMRYQSGAGFLSRHSIGREEALAVIERNRTLAMNTVLKGGWNSADREGKTRPGVPSLVALRPDGTICGRWTPFNDVGPSEYSEGFLRRFEEMFAQAGEAAEESNDHWTTTPERISAKDGVSATVSAADAKDVYLIEAEEYTMTTFALESSCQTPFTLTVTDYSADVPRTLATATGAADGRVCVTARVESAACYVEVSFPATNGRANHPALAITNLSSTVAGYTLSTSGVMSGGDICFKETSKVVMEGNVTKQVMIQVERRHGDKGEAKVKVRRIDSAKDDRVLWNDATLIWDDGESGMQEVPLTIVGDELGTYDLSLRFELELLSAGAKDTAVPAETSRMTVRVRDDDLSGVLAYRNVECLESYELGVWQEGDVVEIRKTSGSLPSGLSLAVSGGEVIVSGSPSTLGSSSATYVVTVKRNGEEVYRDSNVDFSYTVRAIDFSGVVPSASTAKNYRNIPVIKDGRMAATLTLSVPASGRLSAKIREAGGTTTRYATKSWSAFNEAEGRLSASLASLDADGGTIEAEFASGNVSLSIFGADGKLLAEVGPFSAEPWSASNPANAWEGQYNVQLPQTNFVDGAFAGRLSGAAYMALRMNGESAKKSGTMLYAGVLPNGRAVSGYATLWRRGTDALMAFCSSDGDVASPYAFSGAFTVTPRVLTPSRWLVNAAATAEWSVPDAYGHEGTFAVYGGYYDADEIAATFEQDFKDDAARFAFAVDSTAVVSGRYGDALAMEPVAAVMAEGSPALALGAPNPQAVSLVFSRETGVVHGTLRLPFADDDLAVTYRGISLPGWQSCEECTELPERPWALGACSFADRDESGFFRNGCAVGLGRYKEL